MSLKIDDAFKLSLGKPNANSYRPVDRTAKNTAKLLKIDKSPKDSTEYTRVRNGEVAITISWLIIVPLDSIATFCKNEFDFTLSMKFLILKTI
ncbi:hypothetical protein A0O34_13965 [Chryseobacterium glaciei]|uniref:Uncharacterized protein n=1 Tax=Chryseobacterium glaciei TaxID=1685010 RepID=A0A172XX76_9FLAO|nr:hypothetical protein A0O34_13965 [Chryseobacterium glaciei]